MVLDVMVKGGNVKRAKLSLDEQNAHMRDDKGIQFKIVSEDVAKIFLPNIDDY